MSRVVVVGCGGNIGSHTVPHVARLSEVTSMLLVDPDVYEEKNLCSQDIFPAHVGRAKARVAAERVRRAAPGVDVRACVARIEDLPRGLLRADAVLSCVDTRLTRQYLGEATWMLGTPLIDGAVDAAGLLARVNVYLPHKDAPCMECSWSDDSYASLPQRYTCEVVGAAPGRSAPATNAPSALGAFAGALEAIELGKLLGGHIDELAAGHEVLFDLRTHRQFVTAMERNPDCRFEHSSACSVARLSCDPSRFTIEDALALLEASGAGGSTGPQGASFRVDGHRFLTALACPDAHERPLLHLEARLRGTLECRACRKKLEPTGLARTDRLVGTELTARQRRRTLRQIGLVAGDVFHVQAAGASPYRVEIAVG